MFAWHSFPIVVVRNIREKSAQKNIFLGCKKFSAFSTWFLARTLIQFFSSSCISSHTHAAHVRSQLHTKTAQKSHFHFSCMHRSTLSGWSKKMVSERGWVGGSGCASELHFEFLSPFSHFFYQAPMLLLLLLHIKNAIFPHWASRADYFFFFAFLYSAIANRACYCYAHKFHSKSPLSLLLLHRDRESERRCRPPTQTAFFLFVLYSIESSIRCFFASKWEREKLNAFSRRSIFQEMYFEWVF